MHGNFEKTLIQSIYFKMQNNLNISGEPIQSVYSEYKKGKYIVNRRYQRKLVWTLAQKQKFIDSLLNQYPVPLFLGVRFEHPTKGTCFEILDGMQRLEAITSFIEGSFPVDGKYFDLSIVAETNRLVKEGKIKQKNPRLDFDSCNTLLNYPLPISTSSYTLYEKVDETFRRINTGGVILSRQEVRQAGILSEFSQLVRRCSIYIRGDVSHTDIVELAGMRIISITKDNLDYGIKLEDTFWRKNRILTDDNIFASKDEELVAHVLLHILLGTSSKTSSKFLDEIYAKDSNAYREVNNIVAKHGLEELYKRFCFVYDELVKVIRKFSQNYAHHLYKNNIKHVDQSFQVLFISFYQLLLGENRCIQNYDRLASCLRNIASDSMPQLLNNKNKWLAEDREKIVKSVQGVIREHFVAREGSAPNLQSYVDNLENILTESRTENVCYDFKIGLHGLKGDENFNKSLLSKIVKTLAAMVNSNAGESLVVLGVADKEKDAQSHEKKYQVKPRLYGHFYVTGVGDEADMYHGGLDEYKQKLQQCIDNEPIDDAFKRQILRNVVSFRYYEKDVIVMKVHRDKDPIKYDGKIYVRKMSHNEPKPIDNELEFYREFINQTNRYPYN